jgi:hypothetical protein
MTARSIRCASLAAVLAAVVAVSAQQAVTPPAFQFERPILTGGTGPRRLPIDVPLLIGGAPFRVTSRSMHPKTGAPVFGVSGGLTDLRLYDANGTEVGYVLVGNTVPLPVYQQAAILRVASVETRTEKTSGFEADIGELMVIDRFRIDGLKPPFLKRVKLEASGDRRHWTLLVPEGTLFDLPDEALQQVEMRFTRGSYRYLRVTWDDTNSARLAPPSGAAAGKVAADTPPAPLLTTPLAFERRPSEPGRSRFRIRLPGGPLPIFMLHLDVGGGHVLRAARVFEARLSGTQLTPVMLGRATLARVVRGNLTAADLRIGLEPPSEAQLDLEVDDGDNAPLDLRGVTAELVALPWIYFEAPGGAVTARYGNATLTAPRYDLEAARDQIHIESVADATWGESRARSAEENAVSGAPPLPTVGASLDAGRFKYIRSMPAGNAGLLAVALDANVLAHSTGPDRGFADLRVVDAADRQIPYIVEQAAEPLSLDLAIEQTTAPRALPAARSSRSVYRVKYPVDGLPAMRLVLSTPARVFERRVTVVEEREADSVRRDRWIDTIADASWVHADPDRPATPLTLSLPPAHATTLLVIVDEGDNTPLPIERARLLLPAYRIRLFREVNARLRVAYGRMDLSRPRYDLALLAPRMLGTSATDVALDPEQPAGTIPTAVSIMSARLFWGALAIAIVILLGLIARLLKKESAG